MNRLLDLPLFLRIILGAAILSAAVVAFAGKAIPSVPLLIVFAWVIAGIAVAGVFLIAYFVVVAGWNTWNLDGDTNTQWLCFDSEPAALHESHDGPGGVGHSPD